MELESERKNSSALRRELTPQLYSLLRPGMSLERLEYLRSKVVQVPALVNSPEMHYMSREELVTDAVRHTLALRDFQASESLTPEERYGVFSLYSEISNVKYHFGFFKEIFDLQASEEQKAKYNARIESLEIISCFAQTELGHGSFVRGLETTATYDSEFDGFTIHTPTITATKWWVGALGVGCNYVLLVARLVIQGTDYGPHAFFIQIRDMNTHEPLPGITVGDIGPKIGLNGNDNGFLQFEQFKVPREALLNRFASVKAGGEYEIRDPNGIKILYFSMVKARADIVFTSWLPIFICSTIAIRYSIGRRQYPDPGHEGKELQLINYQIQQHKLFVSLAFGYATFFAKCSLERMLNESDESKMEDLHAIVSMYKSAVTDRAVAAMEVLRRSCGGHGYLTSSGFHNVITFAVATCTYDGDNSILALQTAKYIMKIRANSGANLTGRYAVFANKPPNLSAFTDPTSKEFHNACFANIAFEVVDKAFNNYKRLLDKNVPKNKIWNSLMQIEGVSLCQAFFIYCLHLDFIEGIQTMQGQKTKEALELLRRVYALNEILKYEGILIEKGINHKMIEKCQRALEDTLKLVRPVALPLVEAFELHDVVLNSTLGRKDGKFYEEMVRQAIYMNPLNKEKVFPGVKQYLRPKL